MHVHASVHPVPQHMSDGSRALHSSSVLNAGAQMQRAIAPGPPQMQTVPSPQCISSQLVPAAPPLAVPPPADSPPAPGAPPVDAAPPLPGFPCGVHTPFVQTDAGHM